MPFTTFGGATHTFAHVRALSTVAHGKKCRSRRTCRVTTATSYDNGRSSSNGSRLIMPGQANQGGQGQPGQNRPGSGGLIMPGNNKSGGSSPRQPGTTPVTNFRPPPGFMDSADQKAAVVGNPQELLAKLRSGNDYWHELAKSLTALQRLGYDWLAIESETGLERATQSIWTIAGQVFDSLKAQAIFPQEKLKYFNSEDSEFKLYPMRVLSVTARAPVAEYIVDHNLNTTESEVLTKAFKEHERRKGKSEGFAYTPADALAFKYYRDALECRKGYEAEQYVRRGLEVAETEQARAKLRECLQEQAAPSAVATEAAPLAVMRLTHEELSVRPVAMAGNWSSITAAALQQAPAVTLQHPWNVFETQGAQQWITMPAWSAIVHAQHPVALVVDDCAQLEVLMQQAKKKEDKKRLEGPGLLLLDKKFKEVQETEYYVVTSGQGLQLAAGSQLHDADILARVLFCARPPRAEMTEKSYP